MDLNLIIWMLSIIGAHVLAIFKFVKSHKNLNVGLDTLTFFWMDNTMPAFVDHVWVHVYWDHKDNRSNCVYACLSLCLSEERVCKCTVTLQELFAWQTKIMWMSLSAVSWYYPSYVGILETHVLCTVIPGQHAFFSTCTIKLIKVHTHTHCTPQLQFMAKI